MPVMPCVVPGQMASMTTLGMTETVVAGTTLVSTAIGVDDTTWMAILVYTWMVVRVFAFGVTTVVFLETFALPMVLVSVVVKVEVLVRVWVLVERPAISLHADDMCHLSHGRR
jgi:hypothetical protein